MGKGRVFGVAPGVDFPRAVADALVTWSDGDPVALARMTVLLNSDRMRRRVRAELTAKGAMLLPRLGLVTHLDDLLPPGSLDDPAPPTRQKLELAQLVARLIEADPTLAPRSSIFDLADSLSTLLSEMAGEGVPPDALSRLDVTDESGHWQRAIRFLEIVQTFLDRPDGPAALPEARLRAAATSLSEHWKVSPPTDPVIIAGSTGSRGTTALLMQAVSNLDRGILVLPGYDADTPADILSALADDRFGEDHPQARLAALLAFCDTAPDDVLPLGGPPPDPARNKLVSLALRPAPVTDQWRKEGPALGDLSPIASRLSLIEAAGPRAEADAIALILRDALAADKSVAVITPDRMLTRQIEAALMRWQIEPDDSAGKPLSLSPPGRLLRLLVSALDKPTTPLGLVARLSHPLTATGADRGQHLLDTRKLEVALRRKRAPVVSETILKSLKLKDVDEGWVQWVADRLGDLEAPAAASLSERLQNLEEAANALSRGWNGSDDGNLWKETAGREASAILEDLKQNADVIDAISTGDFRSLIDSALQAGTVRKPDVAHPGVMVWGTLEARVQGADLAILAGLNDGIWPAQPAADPWLNRRLRRQAGLLLPDRQIGLSAHDFQQAIAAPEVILSRARRDTEAETVPSRWLNRLLNLMSGLKDQGGEAAISGMRARGDRWLAAAAALDRPDADVAPARRPSPAPPVAARPRELSISDVQTLIRDPYAVYARRVLGLRRLDPLVPLPDAAQRGTALHKAMEHFVQGLDDASLPLTEEALVDTARRTMAESVPWPVMADAWAARLERIAPALVAAEALRRQGVTKSHLEAKADMIVPGTGTKLSGKADRIDVRDDGQIAIYDYKSGGTKSEKEMQHFEPQLLIESVMAEYGAFKPLGRARTAGVGYISLGSDAKSTFVPLDEGPDHDFRIATTLANLVALLTAYDDPAQGFTSRRAMARVRFEGDYDHLARAGEWDDTQPPEAEVFDP